ncbi:MAG: hypothetical protein FJ028_00360 [Chloroflexi bacterium]|nr:hypothetical protein [Chloroflexota bacterium]
MTDVHLPRLGATMEDAQIARWLKAVGDRVTEGEALVEIDTDKVSATVDSPATGRLTEIRAHDGDTVAVGAVLAVVDDSP